MSTKIDELREQIRGYRSAIESITADMRDKDKTADRLEKHKAQAAYHAAQVQELELRLTVGRDMISELRSSIQTALDEIHTVEVQTRVSEVDKLAAELRELTKALGGTAKVAELLKSFKDNSHA